MLKLIWGCGTRVLWIGEPLLGLASVAAGVSRIRRCGDRLSECPTFGEEPRQISAGLFQRF